MTKFVPTTLFRDDYGCLGIHPYHQTTEADIAIYNSALELVALAEKTQKIPRAYNRISNRNNKFSGNAVYHEIYDISPSGKNVLVCVRETEGSKYGVRTTQKTYYLVTKCGKGVKITEVSKAKAAKAAKAYGNVLGAAIAVVTGKAKLKIPSLEPRIGYKMVKRTPDGQFVSVWDESPWDIGKTRIEAATDDHSGGFYCYASAEDAIEAALNNEIFGECRSHRNLVMLECEVSGKQFLLPNKKLCVSRIKPLREFFIML